MPRPRTAQEGGLVGHGLPPHGVQDPILLKLGDVLQRVPGATAGGFRGYRWQGSGPCGEVAPSWPSLSFPATARAPREDLLQGPASGAPTGTTPPITPPGEEPPWGQSAHPLLHSLLMPVTPLLGGGVQLEQLWFPGHEVLLALAGPLPLCLLQRKLLLCGLVLVTLADGPGDVVPEPGSGAHALSG